MWYELWHAFEAVIYTQQRQWTGIWAAAYVDRMQGHSYYSALSIILEKLDTRVNSVVLRTFGFVLCFMKSAS